MKTKVFRLHHLFWSPLQQAVVRWLTLVIMASACIMLVSGCMVFTLFRPTTPVLHKPLPCDLSPVLKLQYPEHFDTLASVPRTKTIVENGINMNVGEPSHSHIKERFYLCNDEKEYIFTLFLSESAAKEWYEFERRRHPVFREVTKNGLAGRVYYTEEPRADPEGGSGPMGYYLSRADFRLHNLYIRVVTKARESKGEKPQNDKLSNAVKNLGKILKDALIKKYHKSG